jgi:hypothetical protein
MRLAATLFLAALGMAAQAWPVDAAPTVPRAPEIGSNASIIDVAGRCGRHAHFIRGHRTPSGHYIRGRCVPYHR